MRRLSDIPIKRKLMLVALSTCLLALALAGAGFLAVYVVGYRLSMARALVLRADILGTNSAAALAFHDPKAAAKTLATMRVDPHTAAARVEYPDGRPLAAYDRPGKKGPLPARPAANGYRFARGRLTVARDVLFSGKRIGTVRLVEDTGGMYAGMAAFLAVAIAVVILSAAAALWVSARLQRLICDPILELTRIARTISEKGDDSARAVSRGRDELGLLVDGFNEMLDRIKERSEALRQALSIYEATLDSTADGILVVDAAGRMISFNLRFARMWGLPADILAARDDERALDFATRQIKNPESFLSQVRELYGHPQRESFDRIELTDGRVFERYSKPQWLERSVVGRVWSFRDVTGRDRAEKELRKLTAHLEQRVSRRTAELTALNQELESYNYSVSHDLRAPLRAIDGFSLALLEDYGGKLDGQGRDFLRRIRAATQHMGEIIDDLLTLSSVTHSEMRRDRVDLSGIVAAVAEELQAGDPRRAAVFEIAPGARVVGDGRLLRLMMENLLGNAWKFTSKAPRALIGFEVTRRLGRPAYAVRDNGAGFDAAYAGRLFKPFSRLHSLAEYPGTGIGLATVARIVQRHGGRIWGEGAVGKGAVFYFTLSEEAAA